MVTLRAIHPLDQPIGRHRLLAELKTALNDDSFTVFRMIVAYAKSGPLHRLADDLSSWRARGGTIEAIFGIDQRGTSQQAAELATQLLDKTFVTQEPGITFHPKVYVFKGDECARVFVGSNNLTVGGTETNFESAILLELSLPADQALLTSFDDAWAELLPENCSATKELDAAELARLIASGDLPDERTVRIPEQHPENGDGVRLGRVRGSTLNLKPPSPLPSGRGQRAGSRTRRSTAVTQAGAAQAHPATPPQAVPVARGLAIQVRPHHNGEIFLSVSAALENPDFFGWPFTGSTTPKKATNPAYPQRVPDPIVNITVYGAGAIPVMTLSRYPLNTVYYENKSEIRVTASPLVDVVPEYSVMILELGTADGIDYEITIHTPTSSDYTAWLAACNQAMPGGGREPRKYGWF